MTKYLITILTMLIFVCSCADANTIAYKDVNGVPSLFINAPYIEPEPPIVNPPLPYSIGIPPPFSVGDYNAIDVTYRIYDSNTLQVAARVITPAMVYQASDSNGYFTHYVDATIGSDTGNTYGSIKTPRKTIPSSLPAGSIVEVHNAATWASLYTTIPGTEDLPVFIRGVNDPNIVNSSVILKAYYTIVEGFRISMKGVQIRTHGGIIPHHVCFRNCTITGDGTYDNTGTAIQIYGLDNVNRAHDIVIYNNEISYAGQYNATSENDCHGVKIASYASYIWILNNKLHHLGGDSVQVGNNGTDPNQWLTMSAKYIYIAGNEMHDNYEDGIDIKTSTDVICSQNTVYNMVRGGVMFGQLNYHAQSVWFLFNRGYNCFTGFNALGEQYGYAIGNIVYDTVFPQNYGSIGVGGVSCGAIGNIIHHCPRTLKLGGTPTTCTAENNIISEEVPNASYSYYYLESWSSVSERINANNNLFYRPDGAAKVLWDDVSYNTVAAWQAATGKGTGTVEANPLFVDPDNGDFNLQAGSPAIGNTFSDDAKAACNLFFTLYNIDITDYVENFVNEGTNYVPDEI